MYSAKWLEPENYTKRRFFDRYKYFGDFRSRISLLNFSRGIKDAVMSLVSLSEGRIGVMWNLNLDDPLFLNGVFFRIRLSDGRMLQLDTDFTKTSLYRLVRSALFEENTSMMAYGKTYLVENILFGRLQYMWLELLLIGIKDKKYEVSKEDISAITTWARMGVGGMRDEY